MEPLHSKHNAKQLPATAAQQHNRAAYLQDNRNKNTALSSAQPVQLTKEKTAKGTVGSAVALGLTGALVGSYLPVVGTFAGGLIGAAIGGIGGYLYSKPKLYKNRQPGDYKSELKKFRLYQKENTQALTAYNRGTIIKYSSSRSRAFVELLHQGKVLYTYDENNQLAIGSDVGDLKHAIVAENKRVKAAGHAQVLLSKQQDSKGAYEYHAEKLERFSRLYEETKDQAKILLKRNGHDLEKIRKEEGEEAFDIVSSYNTAVEQINYHREQMKVYEKDIDQEIIISKGNPVKLDNSSGHYHPGKETKDEAFEGWRNAGFKNLQWQSKKV